MSPASFRRRAATTAVCLAALALGAQAAAARDCRLETLEGASAELWTERGWRALSPDALPLPLPRAAAILRTGPDARLLVLCDDGVAVTVGVASEVDLGTLVEPSREGVVMRLLRGALGAVATGTWPRFEVRTPLAIAAVRSTEWAVTHSPEEGSAVFVRAGAVAVRPAAAGAGVLLQAGEGVDVAPDGALGPPARWGAARVAALGERLGPGWR
ncbi:FecR family protein [Albimonas sp. CAU 1670]|uniref:FecR family protein n=1 Tax=Albimonas sp. CAU 1670 TaxID=3032599 RepID=UPI0023DB6E1B|nr:FecR family protein [Albimonas sp. CAU 1670]MDF2233983.1 FecR family protein [Albimonas sp. CAU 1670]